MPAARRLDPFSSLPAYFGSEIRRLRERLGWTQEKLADELGWSLATIASVETARRNPPDGFPEKADEVYDLPEMLTHLAELLRSQPRWFEHYIDLEAQANRINIWSGSLIPGLFQMEEYARSVMIAGRPADPLDMIEERLAERLKRQHILDRPSPPTIWAVLHEAAIRQPVKNVEVTQAQLRYLIELARRPNITVQVLPFAAGEHAGGSGPFTLFDFKTDSPVAIAECRDSGRLIDSDAELGMVRLAYDLLKASALSPESTIGLIMGAMSHVWIDRN